MSSTQISVDTAQFGPAADNLGTVGERIAQVQTMLAAHEWNPPNAWRTAAVAETFLAAGLVSGAGWAIGALADTAHGLGNHLVQAQQWYEQVDAAVVDAFAAVADSITSAVVLGIVQLGAASAGALVATLASPAGIATLAGVMLATHGLERAGVIPDSGLGELFAENGHALANPFMVSVVRTLVSGSDEMLASVVDGVAVASVGSMGAAAALALFGPIRQRLNSPQSTAGAIADGIQAFKGDHRHQLVHTESGPTATPDSIADLVQQVPATDPDGSHVTITEYRKPDGSTVYVVNVAGTSGADFGGDNPLDNLANLASYAGQDDESIGAAALAMQEVGINPGDEIVLTGYSQGALVAAELARSGEWDVGSVVLAGSPVHANNIGGEIPVVQLEHAGDLIVGLQGYNGPATGDVAVVERDPYPTGVPQQEGILGPHKLSAYQDTAALYDAHDGAGATANREAVLDPLQGAVPVKTHDFHIDRVYDEPPSDQTEPAAPPPEPRQAPFPFNNQGGDVADSFDREERWDPIRDPLGADPVAIPDSKDYFNEIPLPTDDLRLPGR